METESERKIGHDIAVAFNSGPTRLFKNVSGNFWTGKMVELVNGVVKLAHASRVKCGLVTGASDRIGFHQIIITPEMVGKTIPAFMMIELKTVKGVVSPEQQNFLSFGTNMGCIAGVARSVEDVENILANYLAKLQSK